MQALMNTDYREKTILLTGFLTSWLSWAEVARIDKIQSLINSAKFHCCNDWGYANLKTCSLYVVKVFGSGISINTVQNYGFCIKSNLNNLSTDYTTQHIFNIITGLIGTVTVISLLTAIGKRTFGHNENHESDSDSCDSRNVADGVKNVGLFFSLASLLTTQYVGLIFSIIKKTDSDNLYSKCCDWDWTYPAIHNCVSAIENVHGYGLNFTNYPDLCGGNVIAAKDNANSALIYSALTMAAIAISILAIVLKVSHDQCLSRSTNYNVSKNATTHDHRVLQDTNDIASQNDDQSNVELSSSSSHQDDHEVELSSQD